ncbi:MAG: hypothetical protein HY363_00760, partial [Candidatus Aenigmarchaeota archaeon]|nr:hypothetical protein [Candidatus Aenigmarchaeota archaeon]
IKIKTKDEFELVAKTFNKMRKALLEEKTKSWQRLKKVERLTLALTHMLNRLKKSYEKIKDLDRLKDEFLQSTSHELKTPLTSLSGFTELMMAGKLGKLTKKQSEATKVIKFDVERLTNSITKILDVARIEAGKKLDYSTLDLNSLVKEIVSPLKLAAQHKKLDFTTTLKHLPKISADKKWLVQVIQNLVHNAVKYTQKGKIIVATEKDGNNVKLTVTDTGPGIKSEYIQFLFTKFFQVTHTQSGSGLGLYICKKVIDQHGGKMIVNSEYGKGSTFGFTIPIKARKTTL